MKEFTLYWNDGRKQTVSGENISDAVQRAGLGRPELLLNLEAYKDEETGEETWVVGKAPCGCWYHAWDGHSCMHDLAKAGIYLFV